MNILYIQHVNTLPPFFPQFLDICAANGAGLGKVTDKGWIISSESMINGNGKEVDEFNHFMRMCQSKGYDSFYTTKNPL